MSLTVEEENLLILSVKTHMTKRPLSPTEVWEYMSKSGMTDQELANLCQISTDMVKKLKSPGKLISRLRHLVGWGRGGGFLGQSVAAEIAKERSSDSQNILAKLCMEHQLTKSEVIDIRQRVNQLGSSFEEATTTVINSRPRTVTTYLIMGSITELDVREHIKKLTQSARDQLLNAALAEELPLGSRWNSKLGLDSFSITCGEEVGSQINSSTNGFEEYISGMLLRAVK